jgi:hypothetical protein
VPEQQLQQLLDALVGMVQQAKPQEVSNALWAVATMQQQMPGQQLRQLLNALVSKRQQANPQDVSNTLWAVATMGQQVPEQQLQHLLSLLVSMSEQVDPQAVANSLWACGRMQVQPQQVLAAPGLADMLLAGKPQHWANAAWACGQLGHTDDLFLGALLAEVCRRLTAAGSGDSSSCAFSSQALANIYWAVVVLHMQQHAEQVLQLA